MKNIEEEIRESLKNQLPMAEIGQEIYAEGFKEGYELANRWIPLEEELPPLERVLLKSDTGYVDARTIRKYQFKDEKLHIYLGSHLAKFWRPIERL